MNPRPKLVSPRRSAEREELALKRRAPPPKREELAKALAEAKKQVEEAIEAAMQEIISAHGMFGGVVGAIERAKKAAVAMAEAPQAMASARVTFAQEKDAIAAAREALEHELESARAAAEWNSRSVTEAVAACQIAPEKLDDYEVLLRANKD
jgi:hypothetical protein